MKVRVAIGVCFKPAAAKVAFGMVSGWADAAMRWAVAEGLIGGTARTALAPGSGSTRAMVATVLMRYCEKTAK